MRKEVKKMKRKQILGTILALSLIILTVVVAVSPAIAYKIPDDDSGITIYGTSAGIDFSLPPPGGAVADHPTVLKIEVGDWNKKSETGAFDSMVIWVWAPALNTWVPYAAILDIPIPYWFKEMWNGTIVYQESNGLVVRNNIFSVADKELDVWMEKGGDTLWVNLTVPVQISNASLPAALGVKSFTLPPTQIELTTAEAGNEDSSTLPAPYSGYTQNSPLYRSLHTR
jgi:hypothetical protein